VDQIVGVVVAPLDLLQDDLLFRVGLLGGSKREWRYMSDRMSTRERQVFGERARVVAGVLLVGEGVQVAADASISSAICLAVGRRSVP
jgi:hypothetical protein